MLRDGHYLALDVILHVKNLHRIIHSYIFAKKNACQLVKLKSIFVCFKTLIWHLNTLLNVEMSKRKIYKYFV